MEQIDSKGFLGQEASGAPNVARREKACRQNKFCAQSVSEPARNIGTEVASVCLESDAAAVSEATDQPQAWGSVRNEMMECGRCGCEVAVFKLAGGARW